ncbi:chemosensory receptor B [Elysia marginata]|uniref:Chemosensory receptor B n=1 Tax=Elysia marginata TaxID=1093978 RepID=A0AAV4GK33_9GAST|nr:chemosensory receptor B [Elysia marginata]
MNQQSETEFLAMNVSTTDSIPRGVISDTAIANLGILFKVILNPTLGTVGFCANVVNMIVFCKIGLSDGVTQNFFILSISDASLAAVSMVNSAAYILYAKVYVGQGGPENNAQVVYWASLLIGAFPQSVSMITTVVIAVVRCLCVAMPLRVKFLITTGRQLAVILGFSTVSACVVIYAFARSRVVIVHNPQTNETLAMLVDLNWYEYTLFSNVTYYIGFAIVIICVIMLSTSLKKSSDFREKSTGGSSNSDSAATNAKDGRREARVVKTVVFVSIVFIVCYLPSMTFTLIGTLVSEFSADGLYRNANLFNIMVMEMFVVINVAVNIFIYYFCNARYRAAFKEIFGREPKVNKQ